MRRSLESHIPDHDLLRTVDGELPAARMAEVREHLLACWTCRIRMREFERAIAAFVQTHESGFEPPIPPPDGARALLRLRMREMSATPPPVGWWRGLPLALGRRHPVLACALVLMSGMLALTLYMLRPALPEHNLSEEAQSIPDSTLTPGATLPVTKADICATDRVHAARVVPKQAALEVFAAYGISHPPSRAYELDYLITPALGGDDNIRNFWPQPYRSTMWNAHLKDALEDHLHRLVCEGELDLAVAQRDISTNWIQAYRKYFRSAQPLPEHAAYLKDLPWE